MVTEFIKEGLNNYEKCNILKIDCEGCEYEILENTPKSIFDKIDKIIMEYHPVLGRSVKDLTDILEKNNFNYKFNNSVIFAKK